MALEYIYWNIYLDVHYVCMLVQRFEPQGRRFTHFHYYYWKMGARAHTHTHKTKHHRMKGICELELGRGWGERSMSYI